MGNGGIAYEHDEQAAVVSWANLVAAQFPELDLLFCIPNGAHLAGSPKQRAMQMNRLKSEGLKVGVPDLFLPVARNGWKGLFLEMKRLGGELRPDQERWLDLLTEQGYLAVACWGAQEAIETIAEYIGSAKDL